jgi:hypothetical protein
MRYQMLFINTHEQDILRVRVNRIENRSIYLLKYKRQINLLGSQLLLFSNRSSYAENKYFLGNCEIK